MYNYKPIIIIIIIGLSLSSILVLISRKISLKNVYSSKISAYECGFDSLGDARNKFDISFFIVAILFIILDLEISYMFPWAISFLYMSLKSYTVILIFLVILTIGFIYEWIKGGLEWQ